MHYRLYRVVTNDFQAIHDTLISTRLTSMNRLWIRGIIEDTLSYVEEDLSMAEDSKSLLMISLNQAHAATQSLSSTTLMEHIKYLKQLFHTELQVKIRIDLFFARPASAVFILQVYNELKKYKAVEARIVALDFYPTNIYNSKSQYNQLISFLETREVDYISYTDYNVFNQLPDMILYSFHLNYFTKPLHMQHDTLLPIIQRTMFLEYSLTPEDILLHKGLFAITPSTWLQFRTSNFSYNSISWGNHDLVTGHPLLDLSNQVFSNKEMQAIPNAWRLRGEERKVFLWNINFVTHSDNSINYSETRAKISEVLKLTTNLCEKHFNLCIILRPHPLCCLPEFLNLYEDLPDQIIFDRNPDSFPALSFADAYIGDPGSLYMQFLPSERPALIFTSHFKECNFVFWTQTNMVSSMHETYSFVEQVLRDYNSMMRPVTEIDKYCIGPMDGKNGSRIASAMLVKFILEEELFISQFIPSLKDEIKEMEPLP